MEVEDFPNFSLELNFPSIQVLCDKLETTPLSRRGFLRLSRVLPTRACLHQAM